jgi:hypothetical protein
MSKVPAIVTAVFAVALSAASYAHAAPAPTVIAGVSGEPLTLSSARHLVSDQLVANGQRSLRPGNASFDGNVAVEIVTQQGLPVAHVVVHANNGMITDARTGAKLGAKG